MNITEITTLAGRHKRRRRVGRGCGSGMGKTCWRGQKGGGSRSGWKQRGLQEGGQMPTFRRIPKRGFSNARFTARYSVVNVEDLNEHFQAGAHVTAVTLRVAGLQLGYPFIFNLARFEDVCPILVLSCSHNTLGRIRNKFSHPHMERRFARLKN